MSQNATLKAGAAWADVTPPAFTFMTGMGFNRPRPTGVHDRLLARALVLASGDTKVALVTVDINYIDFDHINGARQLIEKYTDVPAANVHITSSHSHSSPGYMKLWNDAETRQNWRPVAEEEIHHVDAACWLIAGAVYEANLHLVDAELGFGRGTSRYNIVRWHLDRDGMMHYVPYHRDLATNIEPLTDMFIMHVREKGSGRSLAAYYTNHAHAICVCMQSDLITADYPGFVAREVEQALGGLCMFAPGTIGDQHPRDFDRGFDAAREMANQLAEEIVKAQKAMKYTPNVRIRAVEQELDLPETPGKDLFNRTRTSVVALNDVALSFWPGEAFGMITRKLEAESPFKRTVLISNTDDFKYYFAMEKEFRKYKWESRGAQPSIYDVSGGDLMLKTAQELLSRVG